RHTRWPRDWSSDVCSSDLNHAGRTILDGGAEPLGRVAHGFGNDGASGWEGCRAGRVVGTYLHGPLLPRNPWFADWLLRQALDHRDRKSVVEGKGGGRGWGC